MRHFPGPLRGTRFPTAFDTERNAQARSGILAYVLASAFVLVLILAASLAVFATIGAATAAALYHSFAEDLPHVTAVGTRDVFKTTRILDRYGNLLYELFDQEGGKRTVVRLADMPEVLTDAVLAAEDASFYQNPGVEPRGIARAFWQNVMAGTIVSGGSTITQQLIRNVLLDPEERASSTLNRKLKEAVLAVELSSTYSKDQIFEWYLNEIYFGNLAYGIGTAARVYFNKAPKELTLAEAALLAGLPQAPATYDPFRNFEAAKRRQESILDLMVHHRFITRMEAEAAKEDTLQFLPPESTATTISYPHWVFYVRSVLEERYGAKKLLTSGFTVHTTLEPHLQDIAEDTVRRHLSVLRAQNATNAALVAIDPSNGEIIAMVGSPDYYDASIDGQVNATIVERQPGSAIKPIVYLAAFHKGFSPGTVIADAPLSLPDGRGGTWRPQNFDNRFRGSVTLRHALGNSLNIPAVKVLRSAGLDDTINLARKLGMTSLRDPSHYGLAFTLGGGEVRLIELATAYTVLANQGEQVPVTPILKIVDDTGRVVFEHRPTRQQVVDPRVAFMVNDILSDNTARTETFGADSALRLAHNRPSAAKTGSTDDYRDSWTVGYTPSLVTGVWVGRADNQRMRQVLGSSGAGRIWNVFMERALEGWPFEPFEPPPRLQKATVCVSSGEEGCIRSVSDWILEERSARTLAVLSARSVAIDRVTGQLADRDTPYTDIVFRSFRRSFSADVPLVPSEYSDRVGISRPWEVLPFTGVATVVPTATPLPGPSRTPTPGPSYTPTPTTTPTVTLTPSPERTPTHTVEPSPTPIPIPPSANISGPRAGQTVSGKVPIIGSASGPNFNSYRLEYLAGDARAQWRLVRDAAGSTSVANDQLDEWDTTILPNGPYWIRMTVVSGAGLTRQTSAVVVVNNPGR